MTIILMDGTILPSVKEVHRVEASSRLSVYYGGGLNHFINTSDIRSILA